MKESLRSIIRHALTGVGSFISYLMKQGWITAEEAAELAPALDKFLDVLAVVLGAVVSRLIIYWLGKTDFGKAIAEKLGVVILCVGTAAGLGLVLPSCTALEGVDIDGKVYYQHKDGAKGGITIVPGKKPGVWFRLPLPRRGVDHGEPVVTPPIVPAK